MAIWISAGGVVCSGIALFVIDVLAAGADGSGSHELLRAAFAWGLILFVIAEPIALLLSLVALFARARSPAVYLSTALSAFCTGLLALRIVPDPDIGSGSNSEGAGQGQVTASVHLGTRV